MNPNASFSPVAANWVWTCIVPVGFGWAALVWNWDANWRAEDRQSRLQVVADKQAAEIAAITLSGDLIGRCWLNGVGVLEGL